MKDENTYNEDLENINFPESLRVNPFVVEDIFFDHQQKAILNQISIEKSLVDSNPIDNSLPPDYFENMQNSIFAKIAVSNLKEKVSDTGFTTPNDYFDNFNDHLLTKISESYLKEIIPTDGFEVPANYFDDFQNNLEASIAEGNLKTIVETDGFDVPKDYFEDIAHLLIASIKLEDVKSTGFDIPLGYFEKLEQDILDKIDSNNTSESKIIKMPTSKRNWYKYGAAAITLLVGASSYLFINNKNNPNNGADYAYRQEVNLGNVSDDEILTYLAQVSDEDDLMKLTKIVEDQNASTLDENKIDQGIENKEIEDYLNYML